MGFLFLADLARIQEAALSYIQDVYLSGHQVIEHTDAFRCTASARFQDYLGAMIPHGPRLRCAIDFERDNTIQPRVDYLDGDGNVVVRILPIPTGAPRSTVSRTSDLYEMGVEAGARASRMGFAFDVRCQLPDSGYRDGFKRGYDGAGGHRP